MDKIRVNKVIINDVIFDVVDGGTSCKDCVVKSLCQKGFEHGVSVDCTSVHLEYSKGTLVDNN